MLSRVDLDIEEAQEGLDSWRVDEERSWKCSYTCRVVLPEGGNRPNTSERMIWH